MIVYNSAGKFHCPLDIHLNSNATWQRMNQGWPCVCKICVICGLCAYADADAVHAHRCASAKIGAWPTLVCYNLFEQKSQQINETNIIPIKRAEIPILAIICSNFLNNFRFFQKPLKCFSGFFFPEKLSELGFQVPEFFRLWLTAVVSFGLPKSNGGLSNIYWGAPLDWTVVWFSACFLLFFCSVRTYN